MSKPPSPKLYPHQALSLLYFGLLFGLTECGSFPQPLAHVTNLAQGLAPYHPLQLLLLMVL